ncbi:hypothetical protein Ciccas_001528 [Cichlidogyrus casuarinus]|uniref:Uncharacterized protein n=1 Tax=Cichlidogyrus casuarinus TaxID=1844966 RepID=A0ABD2QKB5_9PLAT
MPLHRLAKEPFLYIANSILSPHLAEPLTQDDMVIDFNGVVFKDLYFNIQLVQRSSDKKCGKFSQINLITMPAESLINSMITSFHSLVNMAANCAEQTMEEGDSSEQKTVEVDASNDAESNINSFTRFVEKLAVAAQKFDSEAFNFDDQNSRTRLASFINTCESLYGILTPIALAYSSLFVTGLSVRIECPIAVPNLNRAMGLQFNIAQLNITNAKLISNLNESSVSHDSAETTTPAETRLGGLWSWISSWSQANSAQASKQKSENCVFSSPSEIEKSLQIVDFYIKWDLWSTERPIQDRNVTSSKNKLSENLQDKPEMETSASMDGVSYLLDTVTNAKYAFPGLSPENIIASSSIFAMPGPKNWVHCTIDFVKNGLMDVSSFSNIQVHADFDFSQLYACLSPSQLYWLTLGASQISKCLEQYFDRRDEAKAESYDQFQQNVVSFSIMQLTSLSQAQKSASAFDQINLGKLSHVIFIANSTKSRKL